MSIRKLRRNTKITLACATLLLAGCGDLKKISTAEQNKYVRESREVAVRNSDELRKAADAYPSGGVLAFIDPDREALGMVLNGKSPLDAWLQYVAKTGFSSYAAVKLPSSVAPTAIYVPSKNQMAQPTLVFTSELDNEVMKNIEFLEAFQRTANDIQELKDFVSIIAVSDAGQSTAIKSLQTASGELSNEFVKLTEEFKKLQNIQSETRNSINSRLKTLSENIKKIQAIVESME